MVAESPAEGPAEGPAPGPDERPAEGPAGDGPSRGRRADAQRNREAVLTAAASVFVTSGVDAPIRRIAAEAGVGMGTVYRHFPTRADLVAAVYQHQIEACAEAGPALLAAAGSPFDALCQWVDLFVDFLVTKHGLADALRSDSDRFAALHGAFLDRLLPVCARLLDAAAEAGDIRPGVQPYELMRGIGNLCAGRDDDPRYDPRRLVALLLRGLR
ncbi:TetR/AcrR family transcriptional regulator [Streptomyces sp. ODS05-4]|uniref:TetR/AcrR family transcriptional regulator n=1 Tax=Streptomyces sp. ODS05-4 TaxID=2944939 RepID=UPI00210D90A0|nr:TetR/AcrR family transcriptional regulator [Streptomyces sp. ODS05-4]